MQLKFLAKDDQLVTIPGSTKYAGQLAKYVNRKFDKTTLAFPAISEPYAVDSASSEGMRMCKLIQRDACLLPADKETAAFCGVPFVLLKLTNGVWLPAKAAEKGSV